MASVIGNYYIHYYLGNYLKEGIEYIPGESTGKTPNENDLELTESYISERNQRLGSQNIFQREEDIKYLQYLYQKLFFSKTLDEDIQNFRREAEKAVNLLLGLRFKSAAGEVSAENLLKVEYDLNQIMETTDFLINNWINKDELTVQKIRETLDNIDNWLKKIKTKGRKEAIIKQLSANKEQIKIINQLAETSLEELYEPIFRKKGTAILSKEAYGNENIEKIRKIILKFEAIKGLPVDNKSVQVGEVGEWVTSWIGYYLNNKTIPNSMYNIKNKLKQMSKENKQGTSGIYIKYLDDGTKEEDIKSIQPRKTDDYSVIYHVSKTDVAAEIQYSPYIKNNSIKLKISVKNYDQVNNIHLVNNSPLDGLLLHTGNFSWNAHFLNVMMAHCDDTDHKNINALRQAARKNFNKLALYVGLLGYSSTQLPTIFLIFNNEAKTVHVFDPYLLYLKLVNSSEFKIISQYGEAAAIISEMGLLQQQYEQTKELRQKNILSHIHNHKISVAVNMGPFIQN